ncbi:adenosine deaminase [Parasphaerochaeta coccoides]|uniref:adenosine deaminase n=1 Tax=Parasphaerochaeta coccoides TaxID=273376 RepID=UPI001FE1122A|nr:adenosine deaminase [Parasphaerochaeta coccoides]
MYCTDMVTREIIHKAPKVELHDHLDGGLRPATVLELAKEYNVSIPADNADALAEWFVLGSKRKSLSLYLETFEVTVSVLQTMEALRRAACEAMEDLAADNVVYAEIRFAPSLHRRKGLKGEEIVSAVLAGLEDGRRVTGMEYGLIICAMRGQNPALSREAAELAIAFRDRGVVGFDLAGDEAGNPPRKHLDAFQYIRNQNFNLTIHAGEAFGVESIWQAIQVCGAQRIGHGTRLVEDMLIHDGRVADMGTLSHFILDRRIPMEVCLTSNVGTGAAKDFASHPFRLFFQNKFRVFLCTDNRLVSGTTLTDEYAIAAHAYGLSLDDIEKLNINAMKSAFLHHEQKLSLIYKVIKKGYAELRQGIGTV